MAHWRAKTRSWWDERAVYWRSLPPPGTLWREITLTDDQLRLLQDERLVRACYTLVPKPHPWFIWPDPWPACQRSACMCCWWSGMRPRSH